MALGQEFCHARYLELCEGANVSVSTLKRALAGLRAKGLVTVQWNAKSSSLFTVATKSLAPRKVKAQIRATPAVYNSFIEEDRELFLSCKQGLSPVRIGELTTQANEWLADRWEDYTDVDVRDKIDELVFREIFGPEKQEKYEDLFERLYQGG